MKSRRQETTILAAQIERPPDGPIWVGDKSRADLPLAGKPGWQSNGGQTRGHQARSLPFSFETRLPDQSGLICIHFVGVFALFADTASESYGTLGATIHLLAGEREILARYDLVNGRHYFDSAELAPLARKAGDGTSLETIGECEIHGARARVDVLTIDVPPGIRPKRLYFKDLGSPASFLFFDLFFEYEGTTEPRMRDGGISLGELGAAIRVGDRLKFARALEQLEHEIDESEDLDEARGKALTFLAVVISAIRESTATQPPQKLLLNAARELDSHKTRAQVMETTRGRISEATETLFAPSDSPADRLVDRALAIVERHFAKDLTDSMVAAQLGLSTSHFRFLFRQATGHPFHKYVVALRLEKAKQMLIEQEMPISQVAAAVGFTGLSHFSRAFTQRFSASPSHFRRVAG
jgi:AraC-like DNA-binding protein